MESRGANGKDRLDARRRSQLMARIRSKDTAPELVVKRLLGSLRFHFSSHEAALPGTPDFVLARHKLAIFVHGCFWHCHSCARGQSCPATRQEFWAHKRATNVVRDGRAIAALRRRGFRVLILWECGLKDLEAVKDRIRARVLKGSKAVAAAKSVRKPLTK